MTVSCARHVHLPFLQSDPASELVSVFPALDAVVRFRLGAADVAAAAAHRTPVSGARLERDEADGVWSINGHRFAIVAAFLLFACQCSCSGCALVFRFDVIFELAPNTDSCAIYL